jgi:hypothetical protein
MIRHKRSESGTAVNNLEYRAESNIERIKMTTNFQASRRSSILVTVFTFFLPAVLHAAETPDLLKNARLARMLGPDRVVIQGGSLETDSWEGLKPLPGWPDYLLTPRAWLARFTINPATSWRAGDRWTLYPGAGAPAPLVLENFVLERKGSGNFASAVAKFNNPEDSNRIAGLRTKEFLAFPAAGLPGVSRSPLVTADENDSVLRVEILLLAKARALISRPEWASISTDPSDRELDQTFLTSEPLYHQVHLLQWLLPGRKPLLFIQIVWRGKGAPLFGVNAIVEESENPAILDFDPRPGEQMRAGNDGGNSWKFEWDGFEPAFVNAWQIGNRKFILKFVRYYEGYAVSLTELVPGKGLVPVGLEDGDGA